MTMVFFFLQLLGKLKQYVLVSCCRSYMIVFIGTLLKKDNSYIYYAILKLLTQGSTLQCQSYQLHNRKHCNVHDQRKLNIIS